MTLARRHAAIQRTAAGSNDWVPHISLEDVRQLAQAAETAAQNGKGDRDSLIIQTIFDGAFRVSEALQITPMSLHQSEGGWATWIIGKGGKRPEVGISASLAAQLQAYAYRHDVPPDARIFPIDRSRVFRIVDRAFKTAGIPKPPGVGTVHVLRHSGAIELLKATGNPKAVQDHLRHADARMTIKYMKTLSAKESLKIRQGVDWQW